MDSLVEFLSGKYLPKSSLDPQGAYPAIHYGELFTVYSEVIDEVISRTNNKQNMFFSKRDDVLMPNSDVTSNGLVKACCVNQDNVIIGGGTIVMRPNSNKVKGEFLSRYIRFLERKVLQLVTGSTVYHLYSSSLKKLNLFLPKPIEQKKIADCLSSIDLIIETQEQKLHYLRDYKKGLMQQLFPQESETVPRLRFPEFQDMGEWKEMQINQISTVTMGSSPSSSSYNSEQKGLPLLQGNSDIVNRISSPRVFTTTITKECQTDDILLSVRAPVGTVAKSNHHACLGRGLAAIRANSLNLQEYLYQYLLFSEPRWISISQGGTFDSIKSDYLQQFLVRIPEAKEQNKIANLLSSLDVLIRTYERKLHTLQDYKKGLMQQLFPSR